MTVPSGRRLFTFELDAGGEYRRMVLAAAAKRGAPVTHHADGTFTVELPDDPHEWMAFGSETARERRKPRRIEDDP